MHFRLLFTLLCATTFLHAAAEDPGRPLRGVVTQVLTEKKLVLIKHEEIPGFMRAMTMAFSVPEDVWPQLTPGTHLTAILHGSRGQWRLTGVQLTNEKYEPLPPLVATPSRYMPPLIPVPAAAGSLGSTFARTTDGTVYLSWLEEKPDDTTALRFARFDATAAKWSEPRTIASGRDWFVSSADFPALAAQNEGRLTAVWFVNQPAPATAAHSAASAHQHHHNVFAAWFSQSTDDGATWTAPALLTRESESVEFVSLQPLADGRVLAAWLDGRDKPAGKPTQLYARIVGTDGPDQLIDDSVCDCCHTALTAFPDGSALVAYRARREGEVRDIHTARFQANPDHWSAPHLLNADEWHINGCPVNGPQLASAGGHVAVAWFTAADNDARVLASTSPDAGARFLAPKRVDHGNPLGRVSTVLLRNGSQLVSWLEGGPLPDHYIRLISPAGELGAFALLGARVTGFPRITLLKDYDPSPAELLVTYTDAAKPSAVKTIIVTLPDLSTLAGRAPCTPCDEEDLNAVRGYPVKGIVTAADATAGTITVKHEEIPGIMRAMTMVFKVEPAALAQLGAGQSLLGRIEKRGRDWWLFNLKLLGTPPTPRGPKAP